MDTFLKIIIDNVIDYTYQNVSITMNIDTNNLNYDMLINDLQNNLYGNADITILNNDNSELSMLIDCKNRQDFDSALFLHLHTLDNKEINNDLFYKEPVNNDEENDETILNSTNRIKYSLTITLVILFISIFIF